MTQLRLYSADEGQCIVTAISRPNELERQCTPKQGLRNVIQITAAGVIKLQSIKL